MGEPTDDIVRQVVELDLVAQSGTEQELNASVELAHSADIAEYLRYAEETPALRVLSLLDDDRKAEVLSTLDGDDQERVLALLQPQSVVPVVREMESDDAADLLQELDENTANQLLASLSEEDREEVSALLAYEPDTAGGLMQAELVSVPISSNAGTTIEAVRQMARDVDILSVFVVDDAGVYAGNIALQDLVLVPPTAPVEEILEPKVVEVQPNVDQEEVAHIFDHYSLVELGVVDASGKLLGRITADDIHEVLVEEAEEDMLKLAGAGGEPDVLDHGSVLDVVWLRTPWLISTLLATLIASYILHSASTVFSKALILLSFVPVITGMSGNVGTQSAMIMIRSMADGSARSADIPKMVIRDAMVCSLIALLCGFVLLGVVFIWEDSLRLGLCVSISLATSMLAAGVLGSVEPPVLEKFGIDPAIAAGPLITSINDISGVSIYAITATVFLNYLN